LRVVIRHVVGAPDGAPPRVEQAPERITAAGRDHVEVQPLAGTGAELVGVGGIGRCQLAADDGVALEVDGLAQVQQAKAVVARRVTAAVDAQRVVAGHHVEHAQAVFRIAVLERPVRHQHAARTVQVPAQIVVVGQRVEVHPGVVVQREAVIVRLPVVDAAGHHARRIGPGVHDAAVVAATGGVGQRRAAVVVCLEVHHQAVFAAGQRLVLVVGDLLLAAHRVP